METKLIQDYEIFQGRYNTQIPLIVSKGLIPLSVKNIMHYMVQSVKSKNKSEIEFWLNSGPWDTADAFAYYDNAFSIIPNSKELMEINESTVHKLSVPLTHSIYNELTNKHGILSRDKVILNRDLTMQEALNNDAWLKLARGDKSLLNSFIETVYPESKAASNYDMIMAIHLPNDQETPAMRYWRLWGLPARFNADAKNFIIAPSRLIAIKTLENIV